MIFLAFIVPLAIYFLALSHINRSQSPVMIPGLWDFAGLLFAASGFLLLGGPAILTSMHEQWRMSWLLGQPRLLNSLGNNWYFWLAIWSCYFVFILAGAAYLLSRRRRQTSIYNIEPGIAAELLTQALDQLDLDWQRGRTGRVFIRPRGDADSEPVKEVSLTMSTAPPVYLVAVDVEEVALMRHVTLHWQGESEWIRPTVEAELAKCMARVPAPENPAAAWFFSFGLSLLVVSVVVLIGLLAINIFNRLH